VKSWALIRTAPVIVIFALEILSGAVRLRSVDRYRSPSPSLRQDGSSSSPQPRTARFNPRPRERTSKRPRYLMAILLAHGAEALK
jgi:hypothetical protein